MREIPSRRSLSALTDAANTVIPSAAVGFAIGLDEGSVSVLFAQAHFMAEYVVSAEELPDVLSLQAPGVRHADAAAIREMPDRAVEWQWAFAGISGVVSFPVPGGERVTRFWVGLSQPAAPTESQLRALELLSEKSAAVLHASRSPEEAAEQHARLELAAGLLPALTQVLDVRDVFDRLSTISQAALPHDMLTLGLFGDDLTTLTMYARAGEGAQAGTAFPQPYPPAVTQAWNFDILDDRSSYPIERDRPPSRLGMRSSLRVAFKFDGRAIGGLGFHSREPFKYASGDLPIGRRLADYVGVALHHHRLAEEGRRAAAREERATNQDLVDGLLSTMTGVLDVREVFDRIFEISQTALSHDAMSIAIPHPDAARVTLYARTGALRHLPVPWEQPLQDRSLVQRQWDHVLIDDLPSNPVYAPLPSVQAGMRSLVIIPVRLEEELRAWVNFWSATPGRFTDADVAVARRIAAHITLTLSHQRLAEQARLNEELRARTTNLELLDELLAPLIDSGGLPDVFGRISAIAGKVLPHDAVELVVCLPDGRHARVYASSGFADALPELQEIPEEILRTPEWEHSIVDDIADLPDPRYGKLASMGFHSILRVPIRLEGKFAGALIFVSRTASRFTQADVMVARRIADRTAVTLARERVTEASRRADEATERAARLEARVRALTDELDARTGYRRVIGESAPWRQVLTQSTQVAATETTVLLLGESGTGKEVVARFLHRGSGRNGGPFIALNCAALPEHLLEAELFGYERGAYTGATQSKPGQLELAAGGTLFLDEVAEMSPSAQAKFLRVLQEREFQRLGGTRVLRTDARFVAATNRDLLKAIGNGHFREDLYYRLNVFAIRLPALRDRRDDILALSEAFLNEIGKGLGRPPGGISREARQLLVGYHWPGNVRELRNILERASILCDGGLITAEHLAISVTPPVATPQAPIPPRAEEPAPRAASAGHGQPASAGELQTMERTMIEQALQHARFNKSKAAKALGLTRHQLYMRMRKYGFD